VEASGGTGDVAARAAQTGLSVAPGGAGLVASMASLWRDTNFIVGGKASAPGAGGGFELDIDTAEGLYREAASLAMELDQQVYEARNLRDTSPPADDPASVNFNEVGVRAFDAGAQRVEAEADFYRGLAQALKRALGIYQESDQEAGNDVTNSGRDDGSGGGFI
jgi:hypothetical protein